MNATEALRAGAREIWANKFRSLLSFSAISVGVASLLYTLAQTRGMQEALEKNLSVMGPGRMTVEARRNYISRGLSKGLVLDDAEAVRRELPELYMVSPTATHWGQRIVYGGREIKDVRIDGAGPEMRRRDWVYRLRGRFINRWDVEHLSRVCVLVEPGGWFKKPFWAMFYLEDKPFDDFVVRRELLGRTVTLGGRAFTVVGLLKPPPRDADPRWDSWDTPSVIVPISTYARYLPQEGGAEKPGAIGKIEIDTGSEKTLGAYRQRLERLLKLRHRGEEDFEIKDIREEIENHMEQMRKYVVAGLVLGVVALLAGGIGIMNVTLATIFSRIKEIGVRRAVGASKLDILAQFLIEAALLGAAGGAAGIGLGLAGLGYLARIGERDVARLAWHHCVEALLLGAAVSAGFAAFPAYQAARLDPVEALKSE